MAAKHRYVSRRTERCGIGDLTFDLVAGEEVTGLPAAVLETLVDNQQIYDAAAGPEAEPYSEEYRDKKKEE